MYEPSKEAECGMHSSSEPRIWVRYVEYVLPPPPPPTGPTTGRCTVLYGDGLGKPWYDSDARPT